MRPFQNPFIGYRERLEQRIPSDEEWIEKIREDLASGVRWRFWLVPTTLVMGVICLLFVMTPALSYMHSVAAGLSDVERAVGFMTGFIFACVAAAVLLATFMMGVLAFWDLRSRQLLLKYYNAYCELEREMSRERGPAQSAPSP